MPINETNMDFPSVTDWGDYTKAHNGGSREFKALNQAFLNYSSVRNTSVDVTKEFTALIIALNAYDEKKKRNLNKFHLFGTTDRNQHLVLSSLKDFLEGGSLTDDSYNRVAINYTFERLLREKTILAGARMKLKISKYEKTRTFLASLTTNTGWIFSTKKLTFIEQLKLDSSDLQKKNTGTSTSALVETGAGIVSEAGGNIEVKSVEEVKKVFYESVAKLLNLNVDKVFGLMMEEAQTLIGKKAFELVLGFVPLLGPASNGLSFLSNLRLAKGYSNDSVLCGRFTAEVAAPGDATAAFSALGEILMKQSNKAATAALLDAVGALTILDPTGASTTVNNAAQAIIKLYQEVLDFGVLYYQMIAANEILDSWVNTPLDINLDPNQALLVGMKSVSVGDIPGPGTNDFKFKARRAFGGMTSNHFTGAMRESPLLACYFLSESVPADLQAMVAADLAINMNKPFFQTVFLSNVEASENLIKKAKQILQESRFEVTKIEMNNSNKEAITIENKYYSDIKDQGEKFRSVISTNLLDKQRTEKLARNAFENQQSASSKAFKDTMPILSRLLLTRMELEADAQQLLKNTLRPVKNSELNNICKAINSAVNQYNHETSGLHRLHTWRNDESIEAMNFLSALVSKQDLPSLRRLEAAVSFLVSQKGKPADLNLKPLKQTSRLKKLLIEKIKIKNFY